MCVLLFNKDSKDMSGGCMAVDKYSIIINNYLKLIDFISTIVLMSLSAKFYLYLDIFIYPWCSIISFLLFFINHISYNQFARRQPVSQPADCLAAITH